MEKSDWFIRFKEIREAKRLSQSELGRLIGKDATQISRYERGVVKSFPNSIYKALTKTFTEEEIEYIENGNKKKEECSQINEPTVTYGSSIVRIPILSISASAGFGNNIESVDVFKSGKFLEVAKDIFKIDIEGKVLRAIKVDGESMVPRLLPDSWVIFEECSIYSGDGLYILNYNNVLMVKLIEVNPESGNLQIKSVNPAYSSWEFNPKEDNSSFGLVGKVIRSIV